MQGRLVPPPMVVLQMNVRNTRLHRGLQYKGGICVAMQQIHNKVFDLYFAACTKNVLKRNQNGATIHTTKDLRNQGPEGYDRFRFG